MDGQNEVSASDDELFEIGGEAYLIPYFECEFIDPAQQSGFIQDVCSNNVVGVVRRIAEGQNVRVIDNNGNTLLHLAIQTCEYSDMRVIDLLLDENININSANYSQTTPLMLSINLGKIDVALHLIEKGADVKYNTYATPLHICTKLGYSQIAGALIKAGADVNERDRDNDTPLHLAVYYNKEEMLHFLLLHGAQILTNEVGLTPLMLSFEMRRYDFSDILLHYEEIDSAVLNSAILFHYPNLCEMVEIILARNEIYHFAPSKIVWMNLQKNTDFFRVFWTKFVVHYDHKNVLIELFHNEFVTWPEIMTNCNSLMEIEGMDFVKLTETSEMLPVLPIITLAILRKKPNFEESDKDFVLKFVSFLLSYGLVLYDVDLEVIFEVFGYCELFKLLLQMDFAASDFPRINVLSCFIFVVNDKISFLNRVKNMIQVRTCNMNFLDLCPMLTHVSLPMAQFHTHSPSYRTSGPMWNVPKLMDLARNRSRDALCIRYKIQNSRQFYTILKFLNLPTIIKKLIAFEVPIYTVDDNTMARKDKSHKIASLVDSCLNWYYRLKSTSNM